MSKLAKYLNEHIVGNVFERPSICQDYAHDCSILHAKPRFVAFPETTDDLKRLVQFSNRLASHSFSLPLTIRGTGIDKTGASISDDLVVSTERMNKIEEIDVRGRLIRVQPGVTLGALNSALSLQGLRLPISYDPRITIGSLIANCPNDDISEKYGGIFRFVERVEVVLANGDTTQFAPYHLRIAKTKMEQDSFEGALYRKIEHILDKHGDTIMNRAMRRFDGAGYANITRVQEAHTLNLLPLLFASQGTLALISDIILRVEVLPSVEQRLVVSTRELSTLMRFLNTTGVHTPEFIRIADLRIMKKATEYGNYCQLLPEKIDVGWVAILGFAGYRRRTARRIGACLQNLPSGAFAMPESPENSPAFQEFDSAMLGALNNDQDGTCPAIIDDVYIPRHKFEDYISGLNLIEKTLDIDLPVYGSYLTSNYNVRPCIDYSAVDGRKKAVTFLRQYSQLVVDCEGSLTGGSPEGRVKALSTVRSLPPEERELYLEIKKAFDPNNILNPKVKLGAEISDTIRYLRTHEQAGIVTP